MTWVTVENVVVTSVDGCEVVVVLEVVGGGVEADAEGEVGVGDGEGVREGSEVGVVGCGVGVGLGVEDVGCGVLAVGESELLGVVACPPPVRCLLITSSAYSRCLLAISWISSVRKMGSMRMASAALKVDSATTSTLSSFPAYMASQMTRMIGGCRGSNSTGSGLRSNIEYRFRYGFGVHT